MLKNAIFLRFNAPIREQNDVLSNYCTTLRIIRNQHAVLFTL